MLDIGWVFAGGACPSIRFMGCGLTLDFQSMNL